MRAPGLIKRDFGAFATSTKGRGGSRLEAPGSWPDATARGYRSGVRKGDYVGRRRSRRNSLMRDDADCGPLRRGERAHAHSIGPASVRPAKCLARWHSQAGRRAGLWPVVRRALWRREDLDCKCGLVRSSLASMVLGACEDYGPYWTDCGPG
uniref:Uncharacterized protein n=1 Tax=Steinernema glaseri TaxID=37863 RepID=A0A1I7Z7J9_9BILA